MYKPKQADKSGLFIGFYEEGKDKISCLNNGHNLITMTGSHL